MKLNMFRFTRSGEKLAQVGRRLVLAGVMVSGLSATSNAYTKDFLPANIYQLDSKFSHHILLVEKSTHKLYLYKNANSQPELVKTYQVATGKITGDKAVQGDKKTPEGIYQFQAFRPAAELIKLWGDTGLIYGAGAFTTNYPNIIDRRAGKTGGGIWLHSTDDDARVDKGLDSRGCVVATDLDLKDISRYIDLKNTPIVIVQNMHYLKKNTWQKNKDALATEIQKWADAWRNKDFETYINQYSKAEFHDPRKGSWSQFRTYKKAIFSRTESPEISFNHLSILTYGDYAVATMEQDYKSQLVQDIGKKVLYLKKDANYQWKIVAEQWSKLEDQLELAFVPSMRFFPNDGKTLVKTPQRNTSNLEEN